MLLPLATLNRSGTTVVLCHAFTLRIDSAFLGLASITTRGLRTVDGAAAYFRFWKDDSAGMAELRNALSRVRRSPVHLLSDTDVIGALALHVSRGEIAVAERVAPLEIPQVFATPASSSLRPAVPAAPPRPLAPGKVTVISMLPLLEEVKIEGAEVLPEMLQTLAQLKLTMGKINLATASLEPAPSGVAPIDEAMKSASASITSTLDSL